MKVEESEDRRRTAIEMKLNESIAARKSKSNKFTTAPDPPTSNFTARSSESKSRFVLTLGMRQSRACDAMCPECVRDVEGPDQFGRCKKDRDHRDEHVCSRCDFRG